MELYNQPKLSTPAEYDAAEELIQSYMYRNDAEAESVLDKLFNLVSQYEEENQQPPTPFDELDFNDEFEDIRDWG